MAINTVVFGPTGGVGSAAALFAHAQGANVYLAMRDTSKSIPGLDADAEKSGRYTRIQADLTKPDTVSAAVTQAKAETAFFYLTFGQNDALKESIKAMKSAGLKYAVFLSSYSVQGDIRQIQPSESIPYAHAVVEIALDETFGQGNYTAVRPAYFSSNIMRYTAGIKKGHVREVYPTFQIDMISPKDIGSVAGAILAQPSSGKTVVSLCGQQLDKFNDFIVEVGKSVGKDVTVEQMDEESALSEMQGHGFPEPIVKYLIKSMKMGAEDTGMMLYKGAEFEQAQQNVKKYTGRNGQTSKQWIEENKAAFA